MHESTDVLAAVRQALGRSAPLTTAPVPPKIDEPITRLVQSDVGLPELFARTAKENKMGVTVLSVDELKDKLIAFLKSKSVRSIVLPVSGLFEQLDLVDALREAGFDAKTWDSVTLDESYDIDCGITDVWAAVAEVGALVIRGSVQHGRAISLVPKLHVAIVEPKQILPDLVDLFQKMPPDQNDKFVIITGPSKTADIEMALVTGVHGPGVLQLFLLA